MRSGDLDPPVTDFDFYVQLTAHRFDVPPQRVDLGSLDVPVLKTGYAVLGDLQYCREIYLGQPDSLPKFAQSVGAYFVEHPRFVCVNRGTIYGACCQHLIQ